MSLSLNGHQFRVRKMLLLLIAFGAAAYLISPVSADPAGVTITARGSQSYYLGEEIVFSGVNTDSDSTYLFITGPGLPDGGGKLSSPQQDPVSGDPGSFTVVTTKPDTTWNYTLYTSGVTLDPGAYTVYAESQPKTKDQLNDLTTYGTTSIILKKPFITAGISSLSVTKGQPFTITGTAEGNPPAVRIWVLGDNYRYITTTPVYPDSSFNYTVDTKTSEKLPEGQSYLIVQHPMANNRFDLVAGGDYVRNTQLENGRNIFRINGAGSLQGNDAAQELVAAIADPHSDDTYTKVPFNVESPGDSTHPIRRAPL